MIAAAEIAITDALQASAQAGTLGYAWRTLESYPEDFDAYLKLKGTLRVPAAWAVFLGLSGGQNNNDDSAGWNGDARFALVVAAQNLRNETATRHGGPDAAAEPGSYQLAEDAVRVLDGQDFDMLVEPLSATGMRLVARTPEMRTQGLSLMAIEFKCRMAFGQFANAGNPGNFATFHADWDVPPIGNVTTPLPAAAPDAEDMIELPQ